MYKAVGGLYSIQYTEERKISCLLVIMQMLIVHAISRLSVCHWSLIKTIEGW